MSSRMRDHHVTLLQTVNVPFASTCIHYFHVALPAFTIFTPKKSCQIRFDLWPFPLHYVAMSPSRYVATFRRSFMHKKFRLVLLLATLAQLAANLEAAPRLKISENKRFLVTADGKPFFYLGDTAWELFHRLNREQADKYLEDRAKKGFTVIQAVALAELNGLNDPNPYGHKPLVGNDPAKPEVKEGPANDYWDHVDYIVNKAESLGLYI